ncbi:MAG: biotin-dependent carboxyltransferase family protein [Polyangiaceae bacterium]
MIEVVAIAGLATIQDGGRPGRMHQGVPPGGALVRELLARANWGARNDLLDPAIELQGSLTIAALDATVVAADDGVPHTIDKGDTWTLKCGLARVRYAALRGGVDVPVVLGGRGTLLVAGLGGHHGRPLRRGDVLHAGTDAELHKDPPPLPVLDAAIRVVVGPDLDRFDARTIDLLFASHFRVSARSNRVGIHLEGPSLARVDDDTAVSSPMVRGAIQVPSSGEPIVLGPDHPTTGGYPVLATVVRADLGNLAARPAGALVRFTAEHSRVRG